LRDPEITQPEIVETLIPARLDRLPWSRFHWLLIIGLGITWALDGLEVTLMGAVGVVLQKPQVLSLTATQIGAAASAYLAGAVLGSLIFGHLTDRYGRRKFFFVCLGIYLLGVAGTASAWNFASIAAARFITGAGIGGEYSAVNSAIDELIPARLRGRVDLMVNGSYWLGAAVGATSTLFLLNPRIFAPNIGWRVGFAAGIIIGTIILYLRRFVPESPRWLITHDQIDLAEQTIETIEKTVAEETGSPLPQPDPDLSIKIRVRHRFGLKTVFDTIVTKFRTRAILGFTLMVAQAFVYNAILFTYAIVLNRYYDVSAEHTGLFLLPFALANFLGPVIMGHFFDSVGRRPMIAATFSIAAILLSVTGFLFWQGRLTTMTQVGLWTVMFAFASPAGSAAYLTVSEIFPLEIRALAIALFYSSGTAVGGIIAPWLFGRLIESGSRGELLFGYLIAAALMLIAAIVEIVCGVAAENQSLEKLAPPLSIAEG
jgi:MFS family permease